MKAQEYKFDLLVVKAEIPLLYSAGIHFGFTIQTVAVRTTAKIGSVVIDGALPLLCPVRFECSLHIRLQQGLKFPPAQNGDFPISNQTTIHLPHAPHL